MIKKKPTVSICIITYNQEKFIKECIEGALSQKTNFEFEIIIGDDCSTDSTPIICKELASKNSNLINFESNITNLGMIGNWVKTINRCKGKYIALCEGDDYWTDPLKLQKQVDFMEANPDYGICFHESEIKWEEETNSTIKLNSQFPWNNMNVNKDIYTIKDVFYGPFMATASVVFKREKEIEFPKWFYKAASGDMALYASILGDHKIKFINEVMSVYRRHPAGITRHHRNNQIIFNRIGTLVNINKHYQSYYSKSIKTAINDYLNGIKLNGYKELLTVLKFYLLTGLVYYKTFIGLSKKYFASKLRK